MKFTCVKAFFFIKLNRCFNLKKKSLEIIIYSRPGSPNSQGIINTVFLFIFSKGLLLCFKHFPSSELIQVNCADTFLHFDHSVYNSRSQQGLSSPKDFLLSGFNRTIRKHNSFSIHAFQELGMCEKQHQIISEDNVKNIRNYFFTSILDFSHKKN